MSADPATPVLLLLRAGRGTECVFLFPGAGGEARELQAVAEALGDGAPMVGVQPVMASPIPRTVEEMAAVALTAMRTRQPHGPYRLVGYSFGGLLAVEVARLCRETGEPVALLALVDTVFDQRHWPTAIFLSAQLHRLATNLRTMVVSSPGVALAQFGTRARGLWRRLAQRAPGAPPRSRLGSGGAPAHIICDAAMSAYRPSPYSGAVSLFQSVGGRDFGCEPAALWRPLVGSLAIHAIPGRHLDLVRVPAIRATLAVALDAALAGADARPAMTGGNAARPKALLATSLNWMPSARLAVALTEAGFEVEAVCLRGHSLGKVLPAAALHPYRRLADQAGLRAAIARARPQIVIPCDDHAGAELHRLAAADRTPGAPLAGLIARSLGPLGVFDRLHDRTAIMDLAGELGVRRPETARVDSPAELLAWLARHGYPAVIKTDGSWGGHGVALVADEAQALDAFRRLSAPPGLARTLKRLVVDLDSHLVMPCLIGRRAVVSVQAFVPGSAANAAVACFEGKVLAAVHAEVIRSRGATGPATVVQVVYRPDIAEAVAAMVGRLGLSGLCGFDFVLGPDGASLIELNPRATPTCHLATAEGLDLAQALFAALQDAPAPPSIPGARGGLVALFPQEMMRDHGSPYLENARHDVPWRQPELVTEGLRMARRGGSRLRRPGRRRPDEAWATQG